MRYDALDTPPEPQYDAIVRLAARFCDTPIALLTLVDQDRQWFKARVGVDLEETPREHSFCAHALREKTVLVVPDAALDPRFMRNPLVTGGPRLRFYAGALLRSSDGLPLGTLCVYDTVPRQLSAWQIEGLCTLGSQVMAQMELRRTVRDADRAQQMLEARNLRTHQASEQLEAAFAHAATGMAVVDLDGRFQRTNRAYSRITGYSSQELLSLDFYQITHPLDREEKRRSVQALLRGDIPSIVAEKRYLKRDGKVVWVQNSLALLRDAQGRPLTIVTICEDVTERRRAVQALRDNDRRKDEFLAMLAHELRNPLAPIRTVLEVLRQLDAGDATTRWARDVIERQSEHLGRLVDDLLDVSRVTEGKISLRVAPLLLSEMVERALETSRPFIDARGHQVSVQLPPEPVQLNGDVIRLSQLLANLLHNAAKYTPEGGKIEIDAHLEHGTVVIAVSDNGIGIAAHDLERVFELFEQTESTLERTQGGLGIGLTLARKLAERHGGRLVASSGGPGQGSCFSVTLPIGTPASEFAPAAPPSRAAPLASGGTDALARPGPAATSASRQAAPPAPASPDAGEVAGATSKAAEQSQQTVAGRRILIVDDNQDSAQSIGMLLELSGHTVAIANDGLSAIELARAFRPEVVLCDIGLPGLDGYGVAARLIAADPSGSMTLAAMTGYGQESDRLRSAQAGFHFHMTKPIDPQRLERILQQQSRPHGPVGGKPVAPPDAPGPGPGVPSVDDERLPQRG